MNSFRLRKSLFITLIIGLMACNNEKAEPVDQLASSGLLGEWTLEMRSTNNVTDLSVPCCDTLWFSPDDQPDDFTGDFTARGVGYES